jgi:nucleotide-binding universal stress UspA family protein
MMTVTRILVPTDFSDQSKRALDCARTLAEKFDAQIHLLTVVPDPFMLPNPTGLYMPLPAGYVEGLRHDAEAHLEGLMSHAERARFRVHAAVLFGDPAIKILDYVRPESIDLIVMGTHGRGGFAHALMGSVAEKVVRSATCPVLTVR